MLRDALYLARMDAAHLLRRRETLLWTFVMPIIFFYFFGTIIGVVAVGAFIPILFGKETVGQLESVTESVAAVA